ncbi:hypothetical protein SUDANB174_06204 [Streptomyces sp. enrichment culture]
MTPPSQVGHADLLRVWREADGIPQIEHAWLFDHLMPLGGDLNGPAFEAWTAGHVYSRPDRERIREYVREPVPVRRPLDDHRRRGRSGWHSGRLEGKQGSVTEIGSSVDRLEETTVSADQPG